MATEKKLDLLAINQRFKERMEKEMADQAGAKSPFFDIAALVQDFDPERVRNLSNQLFQHRMTRKEEQELISQATLSRYSGKYTLKDLKRKEILASLDARGECRNLFNRIPANDNNIFHRLMSACLKAEKINLPSLNIQELNTLQNITNWLEGTSFEKTLAETGAIKALIKQERLLISFKQQIKHFAGREAELKDLETYLDPFRIHTNSHEEKDPLLIYGVGGIGKSTLIAKFITQLWQKEKADKIPFVYLDFDKITVKSSEDQPFNPLILAHEAFRQLSIQFPATEENDNPLNDIKHTIKYYLEDPNSLEGDVVKSRGLTSSYTRDNLYGFIQRRYDTEKQIERFRQSNRSVLVVLDSFEEFQNVANSTEFYELLSFLDEVNDIVPELVFVIIGRTDYFSTSFNYQPFELGPFDLKASLGFLKNMGIKNLQRQKRIAEKAGGVPLALNLLANLVRKQEEILTNKSQKDFDWDQFFNAIDENHLHEQLVIRNIEHISEEVRELGIPGIIVRKLTPEIIQKVLAGPCKLGTVDENRARELFQTLKREVFLLEEFEGELYFRRDLRESVKGLIRKKYGNIVRQIHDAAIAYYVRQKAPSDRAEYLYHRLMRGDGTRVIDQYYTDDLRTFLERSLWEFEEAERIYLYSKMGKRMSAGELENAPQKEWELYLISQIREVIANKGFTGLREVAQLLEKREKRTDNSPLLAWESKLYERFGEFDKVEKIYKDYQQQGRPVPLKTVLALAKKYELNRNFAKAMDILAPLAAQTSDMKSFSEFAAWSFDFLRVAKRSASSDLVFDALTKIKDRYDIFVKNKYPLCAVDAKDEKAWEKVVKADIPPAYANVTIRKRKELGNAFRSGSGFVQYLRSFYNHFLDDKAFNRLFSQLHTTFSIEVDEKTARKEIGVFLDNRFYLFLEEISEPGVLSVAVQDLACFLESIYEGDLDKILAELGGGEKRGGSIPESLPPSKEKEQKLSPQTEKNTELMSRTKEIQNLIANARLDKAFDSMMDVSRDFGDERMSNDLIILYSRYNSLKKEQMSGLLSARDANVETNRIVSASLKLLKDMEDYF